jgi:hypothetical protein
MQTIILTQHGRPVALAAPTRVWLATHIDALPPGHPRKRLVAFMALYARDILTGQLPGPYRDADAERFARLALIDPDIIARHPRATDGELARRLGVPLEQLHAFLTDTDAHWPRACGRRRRRLSPSRHVQ